jgi:threonine dehydrogenase-like Zn-dependent dehydrogenase
VTVLERQEARAELATALGAHRTVRHLDDLPEGAFDLVVDATGATDVMARTVALARPGGSILLFGVPPRGERLTLDAFSVFEKGLSIRSSYTSRRNSIQAIALLASGAVEVAGLVSHRLPLEAFEHGVDLIEQGRDGVRKVLMVPSA